MAKNENPKIRNDSTIMNIRALALSLLMLISAQAATAAAPKTNAEKAGAYIESLGHKALDILTKKTVSKEIKQQTLENIFKDNVDFPWVGRFVMGRFWRTATPEQQTRYIAAYQTFLIKHYASRFTEYTSGSFKITGSNEGEPNEYTVNMQIVANDASEPPIVIDYKVRKEKASFKVFDIIVEGVSLITTQRSEFASVLNSKGVDGLTAMLESKSAAIATPAK
jgi:phospholipid transport system substrate-binding protein